MRSLRHRVPNLDCKYCFFKGNSSLPTESYTLKFLKRFIRPLKCQLTACFIVQISSWFCYHHLFFCRYKKEVCYYVSCLMSKYIPFLSEIYFICNLHPPTFHTNETHLGYNYTFSQGSPMILILQCAQEDGRGQGSWEFTHLLTQCQR